MSKPDTPTVLLLGAGNMGLAVGRAILASGVDAARLLVLNSTAETTSNAARALGATSAYDALPQGRGEHRAVLGAAVESSDVIIVGVKPYQLASVLPTLIESLRSDTLVISLAAGATLDTLQGLLSGHSAIIRAMPNTPIAVGSGVVALMRSAGTTDEHMDLARALLSKSATVVEISESQIHTEIAAAGSAPAFFYLVAEAMIDEAVSQGLTREMATTFVVTTMLGSARLLAEENILPAEARYAVSSPGGTTVRGIAALEAAGIRTAFAQAMKETAQRSRELEAGA